MDHDSLDLPESQVFRLDDGVLIVCTPEPQPDDPDPDPPRRYDETAARTLLEMRPLILRVLARSGVHPNDIPDLLQTVLLDLLEWWTMRRPSGTPAARRETRAYVAVTAQRAAYRYHRRRQRRGEAVASGDAAFLSFDDRDLPEELAGPSPEDAALAAEALAELAAEMDLDALGEATTPSFWRAFYAWAVLDVPVDVIAEAERVPPPTIYNRLRLAREDLRASLRRKRATKRR